METKGMKWKLVPVEPTEEMLEAALVYTSYADSRKKELMEEIATDYRLMLAVSPMPPEIKHVAVIDENEDGKFAELTTEGTFLKLATKLYVLQQLTTNNCWKPNDF